MVCLLCPQEGASARKAPTPVLQPVPRPGEPPPRPAPSAASVFHVVLHLLCTSRPWTGLRSSLQPGNPDGPHGPGPGYSRGLDSVSNPQGTKPTWAWYTGGSSYGLIRTLCFPNNLLVDKKFVCFKIISQIQCGLSRGSQFVHNNLVLCQQLNDPIHICTEPQYFWTSNRTQNRPSNNVVLYVVLLCPDPVPRPRLLTVMW